MRGTAVVLGIIGILIAVSGAYDHFIQWLNLLGIIVPPIGAVIIMDQLFIREDADISVSIRPQAFLGWVFGSLAGLFTEYYAPFLSTALMAMVAGGLTYGILSLKTAKQTKSG
jgi:cytosine permease